MSDTPPLEAMHGDRDRTPELTSKRERRQDDEDDRDRSHRHRERERDDRDRGDEDERERRHRRHREEREQRRPDETEEERRERHERRRRQREEETEEERVERHRRRREEREKEKERDRDANGDSHSRSERGDRERERDREHDDRGRDDRRVRNGESRGHDERPPRDHRERDRSRESHRSHRSRDVLPRREMSREEKEAERERRDREMAEEHREAARRRGERFEQMDRERARERRVREISRDSSPRRRRPSPSYEVNSPRGRRTPPPPPPKEKDPVTELLEEVDSESRSVFISQISSRLTSQDLGMFFEDMLGKGAVRDARVVTDRGSGRSKGIGYVELDAVELVNRALALSGTLVMGMPIQVVLTESERNREGMDIASTIAKLSASKARPEIRYQTRFPALSQDLYIPPGVDVHANRDASVPYFRLYISNLAFSLTADDLKQVFDPFGEIAFVDLHRDFSGSSKGTAYVQFRDLAAAQTALDAMNGFDLAGKPISVQTIQERATIGETLEEAGRDSRDNRNQGMRMDHSTRMSLMQKLARTDQGSGAGSASPAPRPSGPTTSSTAPTQFVLVNNMFNPEEETERNWDLDLAEDVKGEVEGKYGRVKRIKVDKMSAGDVYIEFEGTGAAERAVKGLNGRFFGGRSLTAGYIGEGLFKLHM